MHIILHVIYKINRSSKMILIRYSFNFQLNYNITQTDTDGDCQHIFLEKRQRALRKKRKKVSAPNSEQYNLGNSHPSSLVSLPGQCL